MRTAFLLLGGMAGVFLGGCGSPEPQPEPIRDVQAQIDKVKSDPKIANGQKDLLVRQLEARKLFDQMSAGKGSASNVRPNTR